MAELLVFIPRVSLSTHGTGNSARGLTEAA